MEVSGQLRSLAALYTGKEQFLVLSVGWISEPVWKLWRIEKMF
jgi:hypothetical protein